MYFDRHRPWALVFKQAAEDRNYWEDHVEKPINDAPSVEGAAALATLQHSDYQPPVNGDIYADITGKPRGAGGPYDPRPAPWHAGAPTGGRPQSAKHPAPGSALALTAPEASGDMMPDGRLKSHGGQGFCWMWCATHKGCTILAPKLDSTFVSFACRFIDGSLSAAQKLRTPKSPEHDR